MQLLRIVTLEKYCTCLLYISLISATILSDREINVDACVDDYSSKVSTVIVSI